MASDALPKQAILIVNAHEPHGRGSVRAGLRQARRGAASS